MSRRKEPAIPNELLDQLLAGSAASAAFEQGGLLDSLKKALTERALNAEMDHHLAGDEGVGNTRNGYGRKTVMTDTGKLAIDVPRDRQASFDPQLIAKYQRRFPGFDEKIVSMYARGMSTLRFQKHLISMSTEPAAAHSSQNALRSLAMTTNAVALSRLLTTERPSLMRLAQRIVGSAPAAEDVTQSLWFRVQRIEDDPPIANKRAFLYKLAVNLATDQARTDRRHGALFESGELPADVPDDRPSAEKALLDRENLEAMLAALDELPPRVREIFMLRKFDEMPVNEIAEHFDLSRSSIAKIMQHALLHCDARLHNASE